MAKEYTKTMRHIIPISGKDSLATALVQISKEPDLPYELVFNPTGAEIPGVTDWINRVAEYLQRPITFVGEDLFEIIEDYNYFLPSRRARYCTRQSKIEPFEKWIGNDECMVYYGIRADENRQGYTNPTGRITPVLPLVLAGMGITEVYKIISEHGLKPPTFFWQPVFDAVNRVVDVSQTNLTEWQIDVLFAGRTRANCYFCFNQRKYEWVWLLDTHPDLFWKAESMEHLGGEKSYYWGADSLKSISENADKIRKKRIDAIIKTLRSAQHGVINFPDNEVDFIDTLSITSCGLFCGK